MMLSNTKESYWVIIVSCELNFRKVSNFHIISETPPTNKKIKNNVSAVR